MSRHAGGYLVDASNLHVGGGVQVAASFLNEVAALLVLDDVERGTIGRLTCIVSSEVAANLEPTTWSSNLDIRIGDSSPRRWVDFPQPRYESVFTVFGPTYRRRRADKEIMGFARGLMIYPLSEVRLPPAGLRERLLDEIRWRRFGSADVLVTETEESAHRVRKRLTGIDVQVVENCVSRAVSDRSLWRRNPVLDRLDPEVLLLAAIGRDYPHKNLDFLARLGPQLERFANRRTRFLVTLSTTEWARKPESFKRHCLNAGIVAQTELGPLYEACEATVFPSLLEISSATPLESVHLGVPLFVADIPSMRADFGEMAFYFDPWDARRAAEAIAPKLASGVPRRQSDTVGTWPHKQSDPRVRALRYLEVLTGLRPAGDTGQGEKASW